MNAAAPSIQWISIIDRVPDNRRKVLAWGTTIAVGFDLHSKGIFLGATRYNPSPNGGKFACSGYAMGLSTIVTHWAEIEGPYA